MDRVGVVESGATFGPEREYRYTLWRMFEEPAEETCTFICLNPSTATETEDDPTVRRCMGFAYDWGYDMVFVGNIFALRSTDPSQLREHPAPVGPDNDEYLLNLCMRSDFIVVAWGNDGEYLDRGREVYELLESHFHLHALDVNQSGEPTHPLYQPKYTETERYHRGDDGV